MKTWSETTWRDLTEKGENNKQVEVIEQTNWSEKAKKPNW